LFLFLKKNCASNTGGHIFTYLSKEGKSTMQDRATEAIACRPGSQSCIAAKPVASQACLLPSSKERVQKAKGRKDGKKSRSYKRGPSWYDDRIPR
jgi:hypothetical protein